MNCSVEKHLPKINKLLCLLIVAVIFLIAILSSVPPVSRDALVHHLAVPKIYLRHLGMHELPSMDFSYYPMNIDLLYLIPLILNKPIAAKFIHFSFSLLTAWLLFIYIKDKLNKTYGLIGVLVFITTPIIVKLSVTAYVDLGLIFFCWASIYCLFRWHETQFGAKALFLSAIFCGLAIGTKYNGLLFFLIMSCFVPLLFSLSKNADLSANNVANRHIHSIRGVGWGLTFVIISLIIFSPWMIRNIIWKGNPIYPLYDNIIQQKMGDTSLIDQEGSHITHNAFWIRRYVYNESIGETLTIPIRAFFQGKDDNPKYFDGKLNPGLLLLSIVAFVGLKKNHTIQPFRAHRNILALFIILFITLVLFKVDYRIRYMAPAIPPLVVLSVFGLKNLSDILNPKFASHRIFCNAIPIFIITCMLGFNGFYIYNQFKLIRPINYITGKIGRNDYISRYVKEHPVVIHANKILPDDAKVLCLSLGKRTFYVDRDVHLSLDFFNTGDDNFSEASLLKKLKRYGTTHVIVDRNNFIRRISHLSKPEIFVFLETIRNHTYSLFTNNGVELLKLL
jgi:hypothetical protein